MWQGKGEGQLNLKVTYFPFELLYSKPRDASLVRVGKEYLRCLPVSPRLGTNVNVSAHITGGIASTGSYHDTERAG